MNDLVVYAGCRVFEVRVSIGAGTSTSPFEQHVLKAAYAGVDTVSGLCDVLGVGPRMMADLLGDLWRADYIGLDFQDERVILTEQVRRLVDEDGLGSLAGAEVSDESRQLMLDTLSGVITPVRGFSRAPDRRLEVPEHVGEMRLESISQAALVEALTKALNEDGQSAETTPSGRRSKRVVRAYLAPASLSAGTGQRRYRPVGIRVSLDEDDQLVVRVADSALSRRHQEAAQAQLTRLVEDQPASSFVRALREAAHGPPQEPATLDTALSELSERTAALGTVPTAARAQQHNEMVADSQRIVRRLEALAEQEAGVTLLGGHPAHASAISQLIADARTQVVLACPWVSYEGLAAYAEALEEAVRRGVQVVLLWGIGREDARDGAITNALSALQRQTVDRRVLISPRTSSIIHAKLAICDDRQAVVSSLNFLEPSGEGTKELGVKVDAPVGRGSPAIEEMLAWARDAMPDYTIAQSIIVDSASFPAPSGGPALTPQPRPDVGADPALTELAAAEPVDTPAVAAWSAAWRQRVADLIAAARGRPASVRLIRDGEHRDFLWTALRCARRRLLITSDGLAEDVVDKAFVDHIQQCVQRGVEVTLVYRRARREGGAQAVARLRAVADQTPDGPGRLRLKQQDNHAKVLVVDDEAVVTSFNFLSFDGYYGGVGRRRQRAEVGVRIFGGEIADSLLEAFGLSSDRPLAAGQAAAQDAGSGTGTELRVLTAAQQLLDRLRADGKPGSRQDLAALTGSGAEELAVLAALRSCGADPGSLEIVAAAVLGDLEDDDADPEVDDWWAWLSQRRFEAGDFTVAAALRQAVLLAEAKPRLALVDVAAVRGTAAVAAAIGDAVLLEDLSPAEWQSLLVTAAYELLREGGAELAEAIEIAAAAVTAPWAKLGKLAVRWWDKAMRPLPVERLRRGEKQRMDVAQAADDWAALDDQLRNFERYSPPFTAGRGTRRFLLRAGGPFSQLSVATQNQDRDAVRSWMEDPKLANVGAWVDAATRAAGFTDLIHGHLRPPFVDRVAGVIAAARAVAEHDDSAREQAEPFDDTIDAARECVRDLRAVLPELGQVADTMPLPERALAQAAVRDLGRLAGGDTP